MKSRKQILEAIENGKKSECLDGRDFSRLCDFFPIEDWGKFGFDSEGIGTYATKELTEENVLLALQEDVEFGFDKSLGKRGISASFMNAVVLMWLWVLDDPLQNHDDYAQYGLPLLKAVAIKYGFPNPIGEDSGTESKYESDWIITPYPPLAIGRGKWGGGKRKMGDFEKELSTLLNECSMENASDTPDFVLAKYLSDCLEAFNRATKRRTEWYGIGKPTVSETTGEGKE